MKIRKNLLPILGLLVVHSTGIYAEVDVDEQRAPRPEPALPIPDPLCNQATCDFGNPLLVIGDLYADNIFLPNSDATPRGNIYKGGQLFIHNYGGGTFIGVNAGNENILSPCSIGVGANALTNLTAGTNNIAIGNNAASALTTGSDVIAIGCNAYQNGTGLTNIAIGTNALPVSTGSGNIALGHASLTNLTSGGQVIGIGLNAAQAMTTNNNVIAIGNGAYGNGTAASNIAIGIAALGGAAVVGSSNIAVGHSAGFALTTGASNTIIGAGAGQALSTGSFNVFVGESAGASGNASSQNVVAIGRLAHGGGDGSYDIAIGLRAMGARAKTAGDNYNVAIGHNAGAQLTSGQNNILIGSHNDGVFPLLTTGTNNIMIGTRLAPNSNASNNVLISNTLYNPVGFDVFTNGNNVIVGNPTIVPAVFNPFGAVIIGNANVGNLANPLAELRPIIIGDYNLSSLNDGRGSVIIGSADAANPPTLTNARNIILIGDAHRPDLTGLNNITIIGHNISASDVNDNSTYISGISGSTVAAGAAVLVNANGRLGTIPSSRRYKHNITGIRASDIQRLLSLRVVDFRYLPERDASQEYQAGMIAEEVAEIFPELVVYDKDGQPETVRYHLIAPMLVAAVQKVVEEKTALEQRVEHLEELVGSLVRVLDARA